jgi:hypothetical protein
MYLKVKQLSTGEKVYLPQFYHNGELRTIHGRRFKKATDAENFSKRIQEKVYKMK